MRRFVIFLLTCFLGFTFLWNGRQDFILLLWSPISQYLSIKVLVVAVFIDTQVFFARLGDERENIRSVLIGGECASDARNVVYPLESRSRKVLGLDHVEELSRQVNRPGYDVRTSRGAAGSIA